jgi:hypothetical protein
MRADQPDLLSTSKKKIMFVKPITDIVASPYIKKKFVPDSDYIENDSLINIAASRNVVLPALGLVMLPALVKSVSTQKHEAGGTNKNMPFSAFRPKGKRIFYDKRFTENMMVDPAIHHPTSLNVGNYY